MLLQRSASTRRRPGFSFAISHPYFTSEIEEAVETSLV
jgi:hypothetical protein